MSGPPSGDPLADAPSSVCVGSLMPNLSAVPRSRDRPVAARARCLPARSPDTARGRTATPPACDPRDRTANQQVVDEGKQQGDEQCLHWIERIEFQQLVHHVHRDAEEDDPGGRGQSFAQTIDARDLDVGHADALARVLEAAARVRWNTTALAAWTWCWDQCQSVVHSRTLPIMSSPP